MRIIDADKLKRKVQRVATDAWKMKLTASIETTLNQFIDYIDSAPSIEITTCYMCKYSHMTYDGQCKYCDQITDDDGNLIEVYFDGSHFCSDGESRSEKPNNSKVSEIPTGSERSSE